ncbi:glycosyltransferase family 1 protein [Puniceicoccaceae bacterium K14]|nr:glycosyltransferase family 1 protein [Puniceicoccaceae bacterium K14]
MRIALVTETFPPEVNGVAMTLGRLCSGMAQLEHEVRIVRPYQQGEDASEPFEFFGCSQLLIPGLPLPGYDGLSMGRPDIFRVYRNLKRWKPDILHISTEGPLGLASLVVARILRVPVSSTFHTNFHQYMSHYNYGFIRDLFWVYLRFTHNLCQCTLSPTSEMAKELQAEGFKGSGVLSRGVDTKLFNENRRNNELRKKWGVAPSEKAIVYVGRVASEKNIDLAIRAFEKIRSLDSSAKMVVVGDGPELDRLKADYPHIYYAGMQSGEDLAEHYASGDLFLFPSVTETFGNVVTEAMSSGLPVLTFDYAAGRQYIRQGENGYLAEFSNEFDFMEKAVSLYFLDNDMLRKISSAAITTAQSISWDRIVDVFVTTLKEIVEKDKKVSF